MNFDGLTKEAKVTFAHILYTEMKNPAWSKHVELLEMVRNCLLKEVRIHLLSENPDIQINRADTQLMTKKEVERSLSPGVKFTGELNLVAFEGVESTYNIDLDSIGLDDATKNKLREVLEIE